MIKNVKQLVSLLSVSLCLGVLTSCYDDKGNYDYSSLNEITVDTSESGTNFVISRFDTLRITPKLQFAKETIDDCNLKFQWEMYIDDWANSDEKSQVLSNEKCLKAQITRMESILPYAVVLTVTDEETGCAYRQKYDVSIQPGVLSGLMVLQNCNGSARLDYLATPNSEPTFVKTHHIVDVYGSANDNASLAGTPRGVCFSLLNKSSYEPQVKRIYVWTDKQIALLEASDFSFMHGDNDLFMNPPQTINPQKIQRGDSYTMIVNDGNVHTLNQQSAMAFGYRFSRELKPTAKFGDCKMSFAPYVYQPDDFPSYTGFGAILYDEIGKRFVKMADSYDVEPEIVPFEQQNESALRYFDVNNIGKDMVWMGKGNAGQGFAVMKGSDNTMQIYRCRFNVRSTITGDDGNTEVNPQVYNLAMGVYDLSQPGDGSSIKYFDAGRYANYLLYATDKNIYTYDFASRKSTQINDAFADDEQITGIKIYNVEFSTQNINNISGTILYVSTWNGTEGKIYEFALNRTSGRLNNRTDEAAGNLKKPLNVLTGFGKIVDMCVKCQGRSD